MSCKQKKRNGFYYFMLEWRKREEQFGRTFSSLREVQTDPRCSDEWKSLTPEEKDVYKRIAKPYKGDYDKKTSIGESMSLIQQRQQEKEEFAETMQSYVTTTIANALKNKTLNDTKFYFIHFNWFYIVEEKRYAPAEYAIGEFTFKDGIRNYHHTLVRVEPEFGYALEALQTSNSTHKIPCSLLQGKRDFYYMYQSLIQFLKDAKINGEYPPLFTTKELNRGVVSLLDQLSAAANCKNNFTVYSIELLFAKLRRVTFEQCSVTVDNNNFTESMIDAVGEVEFLKNKFSFVPNIECDFHRNIDGTSQYCSLAIIKQWAFTICDHCCEPLGFEMRPGIHYPKIEETNNLITGVINTSLNDTRFTNFTPMCKVNENSGLNVSKRTCREEKESRKNLNDYRQWTEQETSTTYERPLRLPNTKSFALTVPAKQDEDLQSNDTDFSHFSVADRGRPSRSTRARRNPRNGF